MAKTFKWGRADVLGPLTRARAARGSFEPLGRLTTRSKMSTQKNKIEIVPYDSDWPGAFEAEAARLRAALTTLALRIDHHGSTAIPGLGAKPIINIQISVATLQPMSAYGGNLEAIEYVHVQHADDSFCPFFHRPIQWPHSLFVHV